MTRSNERYPQGNQGKNQGTPGQDPKQAAEHAKKEAANLKQEAQSQASGLADQAKQEARSQLDQNRNMASRELDKVAHATRAAASDLGDQNREGLSQYVSVLADNMSSLSDSMRSKSVDELVHDVSGIARQNPALFIAGSLAIGIGLSRFAKSSSQSHGDTANMSTGQSLGQSSSLGQSNQADSGTNRTTMYAGYSDADAESRAGSNWPSGTNTSGTSSTSGASSTNSYSTSDYSDRDKPSTNKSGSTQAATTQSRNTSARNTGDSNSTNNRGGKRYE